MLHNYLGQEEWNTHKKWISGKRTPRFKCDAAVDTPRVKIVNKKIPWERIYSKTLPEKSIPSLELHTGNWDLC